MNLKEKSIILALKRHSAIIAVLIAAVIISILILLYAALKGDYNDSLVVNMLGRQRMLTQYITKSANHIYILNNTIKENAGNDADNELQAIIKSLRDAETQYMTQLDAIKNGYVISGTGRISFEGSLNEVHDVLSRNEKVWEDFKKSIDVLVNQGDNTLEADKALKYINDNDEALLSYSDELTTLAVGDVRNKSTMLIYISVFIAVAALVLLIVYIIKVYRDLFTPISQMYRDMAEIGITKLDYAAPVARSQETELVYEEVRNVFDKLNSLIKLIENLNRNAPFKDVLDYIYKSFSAYIPYTYIGVALLEDNGSSIKASFGACGRHHPGLPKRLLGYSTDIRCTSLGKVLESGEERVINDLEEYLKGKPFKEYNRVLFEEGIRSSITFPLINNDKPIGIIFFSSSAKNIYRKEHIKFLKTLANSIVLGLEKSILMDDMVVGSIKALARLAEQRDPETGEHLQRMSTYSRVIAEMLSKQKRYEGIIDLDYINNIERFSPLHDIGKVGIRDDILLKPGKLTGEEFAIMKTHTMYGAWVLEMAENYIQKSGRSIFKMAIEIAEGHHEKWDGSGYPHGKSGKDIPLSARIVAAADVFDALTSKRPYKEPFSYEVSCEIIVNGSGKHFDPDIVDIFVKNNDKIKDIYEGFKSKGFLN